MSSLAKCKKKVKTQKNVFKEQNFGWAEGALEHFFAIMIRIRDDVVKKCENPREG